MVLQIFFPLLTKLLGLVIVLLYVSVCVCSLRFRVATKPFYARNNILNNYIRLTWLVMGVSILHLYQRSTILDRYVNQRATASPTVWENSGQAQRLAHGGRCSVGREGHGLSKILVGWATMHLAPPIIGL